MRLIFLLLFGISLHTYSQQLEWVKSIGSNFTDIGYHIEKSNDGNIFVAGRYQGNVDFNTGVQDSILSSLGVDFFLLKLDSLGNFIWVKKFGGSVNDYAVDMTLDIDGNVLLSGSFYSTVDFDPGPGVYNLTAGSGLSGGTNGFVLKLDSDGNFLWANSYGPVGGSDECMSLDVDLSNKIYVTGKFGGTADFNEGPGVFNLTSGGSSDIFILKLTEDGQFVWAKKIGASGLDAGRCITLDNEANVVVTGWFFNNPDFDPGPGIFNLFDYGNREAFILKLDSSGNFIWANALHSVDFVSGYKVCTDDLNNIYSIGGYQNETMWYVNDLDTTYYPNAGLSDCYVTKHLPSGEMQWIYTFGGDNYSSANEIEVIDTVVYIAGDFTDTIDVDFGPGLQYVTTDPGIYDSYILKVDTNGNYFNIIEYNGMSDIFDIEINAGEILVTGWFEDSCDFDPGSQVVNLYSNSSTYDVFIQKLSECSPMVSQPLVNSILLSSDTICSGESVTIEVNGSLNDASYWVLYVSNCGGIIVDTNTTGIFNVQTDSTTNYFLKGVGSCVTSSCSTFEIVINSDVQNLNIETCDSLQSPSGTVWYTASGFYADTLVSVYGCDSIVNIDLNILNSYGYINNTSCDSFAVNGITYYAAGVYQQIMVNSAGCDSLITIDLTIMESDFDTIQVNACDSVVVNATTYFNSGTYNQYYSNYSGCDSVLTIDAMVWQSTFESLSYEACDSLTINGINYFTSGVYNQVIVNSVGCDSIITLDISISNEDPVVISGGNILSCLNVADAYQWYICSTILIPIAGEINQDFVPDSTANYAVSITINGCTDTSDCVFYSQVNSSEVSNMNHSYPNISNPVEEILYLNFDYGVESIIRIYGVNGDIVRVFNGEQDQLNLTDLSSGLYILSISDEQKIIQFKFVKK